MVSETVKTIVVSGYYGFRNSGDEAVLQSILSALEEEGRAAGIVVKPVVLSINPEWTSRTYGVKAVHRMKLAEVRNAIKNSDGLISGGGSLLQDATGLGSIPYYLGILKLAQWMGKPTFIYAQGVGPVNRKLFRPFIASVFRRCEYISVRDSESAALLHSMGVARDGIAVVPDPVMGLALPEGEAAGAATGSEELPVVGVSVRFWNADRSELAKLAEGLASLCRRCAVHIRFLPFHVPGDDEASRFVIEQMGNVAEFGCAVSTAAETEHPYEMLREVSRCRLLIGMRLHSLIYAASQEVPLLGISYDPKIDHFLSRLASVPVGSSAELDPRIVASQAERLLGEGEAWRTTQASRISELKREAREPAKRIVEYVRSRE
ncbi:polysaccharide pyruvyl transferase CsaB [Paenibacillus antibioticophila]|uniref:Polysaccharide pyruvyl transferase CsaB n=1 Tax=Paenibacillus antibioticophila TaxID=1274374 RepID=A0A919XNW8_9BACL|nr:polysaccharide pyruvyl transferase CsaB [Paenibacillus antibioticophila]GIO35234.1 polysaccharide pyruvyl transferase CsaB [Paenibacillus antibioticophila]